MRKFQPLRRSGLKKEGQAGACPDRQRTLTMAVLLAQPPRVSTNGPSPTGAEFGTTTFTCSTPTSPGARPVNRILADTPLIEACDGNGMREIVVPCRPPAALPVETGGVTTPWPVM